MRSPLDRVNEIIDRMLEEDEEFRSRPGTDLKRLWKQYLRSSTLRLLTALVITIVWSIQPFARSIATRFLVDDVLKVGTGVLESEMAGQIRLLWIWIAIIAGVWAVFLVCHWLRNWLVVGVGRNLVFVLRQQLHEKLQDLHLGFFDRMPAGKILARILGDVRVIEQWSTRQAVATLAQIVRLFVGLGVLLYLNWKLTLIVIVCLPLYAWVFYSLRPKIRRTNIAHSRLNAILYGRAAERISGIRVIKAFAQEIWELQQFAKMIFDIVRVQIRRSVYHIGMSVLAGTIAAVATGVLIYLLMIQVKSGEMTLGSAMAFIAALTPLFTPVNMLATNLTMIQEVLVVLRRVFFILDTNVEVPPGTINLNGMQGKILLEQVSFTYPGSNEPALKEVNLNIAPGTQVAVMGPSGSGKTTLFNLLLRFYDPNSGAVRVGGVNLVDADPKSIRNHVCMVQQEPVIFSGTIADNIMYGHLNSTPAQIVKSSMQSELHDFIMTLPGKYETEVGERGVTLSGGQKQRLSLATAILTDPEVLLLDDTTSALDAKTESRIRATLNKVLEGRTSLIITQRIATARECDLIVVLEKGKITQTGTHENLIKKKGFYRQIYVEQSQA